MRSLVLGIEAVLPDGSLIEGLVPLKKDSRGPEPGALLVGAEGTLGIVTAASLRLFPAFAARAVAWVGLPGPGEAAVLLARLENELGDGVESFELVPASALDLVLEHVPGTRAPLSGRHAWNVLVESTASAAEADPLGRLGDALAAALTGVEGADATIAASEAQAEALWRLRETIAEAERKDGPAAKHDVSVAVAAMPAFLTEAAAAVERRFPGCRVNGFGHLGDGNIHFNVRAPVGAGDAWLQSDAPDVTRFVHDLVTAAGGSIAAEHGVGQAKLAEFARTAPPARLAALVAIKRALDPAGIMNPGKLVPLAKSSAFS